MKTADTLEQIQQLSNERQRLWRLAAKQRLTDQQWERCFEIIPKQLSRLWNIHRNELAQLNREKSVTIARGDIFADYLERADMDDIEDLDELHGFRITTPRDAFNGELPTDRADFYYTSEQKDWITDTLREVLNELREEDRRMIRRRRHAMSLREIRDAQRQTA